MYDVISELDALPEQIFGKMFYQQSVGIFGIEQEGLHIGGFLSEIIHQYALVEHHLNEMVFLMAAMVFVALSGLLFDEYLEVFLHHVHTSLQSQFLTNEGGFEQGILLVEVPYVMRQHIVNKRADVHHLRLCLCVKVGRKGAGTEVEGRSGEEFLDGAGVAHRLLRLLVDIVVEKLAGQVTHQDGGRIGSRLDFVHEIVERVVSVLPKTGGQRTDVNQVIGVNHNKVGNVVIFLVHTHIEQVQRQIF